MIDDVDLTTMLQDDDVVAAALQRIRDEESAIDPSTLIVDVDLAPFLDDIDATQGMSHDR